MFSHKLKVLCIYFHIEHIFPDKESVCIFSPHCFLQCTYRGSLSRGFSFGITCCADGVVAVVVEGICMLGWEAAPIASPLTPRFWVIIGSTPILSCVTSLISLFTHAFFLCCSVFSRDLPCIKHLQSETHRLAVQFRNRSVAIVALSYIAHKHVKLAHRHESIPAESVYARPIVKIRYPETIRQRWLPSAASLAPNKIVCRPKSVPHRELERRYLQRGIFRGPFPKLLFRESRWRIFDVTGIHRYRFHEFTRW